MMSAIATPRNGARFPLLLCAAILLAACAGAPQTPRSAAKPQTAAPTLEQLTTLARDALPAERPRYQLDAVDLLLRQNQPDQAQEWLKQIPPQNLDALQRARYQEMQARLALARNNPQLALKALQEPKLLQTQDQLPASQQTALALTKARVLEMNRNYLASAQERAFIDALLDGDQRAQNEKELWRTLQAVDANTLTAARSKASSEEWRGWLDLALVYKRAQGNPTALASGIEQWKQQWRAHPARAQLAATPTKPTATAAAASTTAPRQIALLLPLGGKFAGIGGAVRDGFMAAWYEARAQNASLPTVRIYDTTASANFIELYQKAVADGAQAVVGPLEKSQVAALYGQTLPVPTLALNRAELGSVPPAGLYQFGLAPEDEAEDIARLAAQANARHALIVAPEEDRNARELQAFTTLWQQQGGDIVATALFHNPQQLSQSIRTALNIPQSDARKRELESLFGRKLEFTPHRRGDIDMVLVLARPQQARSIVPTLAYHYAGDIPTYALSRSYNGVDAPDLDRDLEGLRFTEMPWLLDANQPLKQKILASAPQSRSLLRLYALGIDSFALLPQLRAMEMQPDLRVSGQTGTLSLSTTRLVVRELPLAQMRDGLARPLASNTETTTPVAAPAEPVKGTESPIDATVVPDEPTD